MTNKIKITIPEPCHENWQAMSPVEKGRFCASCKKNVIDFTFSTDREIIQAYNTDNKLCGRFTTSQLNRDLVLPKEKSSIWLATTSAIISFLGTGTHEALAQGNVKVEQTEKKVLNENRDKVQIRGIVLDSNNIPLPNIFISFKGNQNIIKTDIKGEFCIEVFNCTRLTFYQDYEGYEYYDDNYIVDGENLRLNIICRKYELRKTEGILGGIGVIKKRTFFGRMFHSIGNWFR